MIPTQPTRVVPLGDQAVLAYFADEGAALRFARAVRSQAADWLIDVVQAYASVAVFFDLERTSYAAAEATLRGVELRGNDAALVGSRTRVIPCCYELGPDVKRVAEHTGLTPEQIIRLHLGRDYVVYAVGFCPGFAYLGYLDDALAGVPRLPSPRIRVEPGSVGLTGRQTGIYPLPRPGGWNLIGRTPLELVDVADGYFPLAVGDHVRFERIDEAEFRRQRGRRL